MVKYFYDVDEEGFRRVDRRGRILPINIVEARRIQSLLDLGWGVDAIHNKMVYTQNVSKTTTKSFIKNLREGNIDLEGDYPTPRKQMENMDLEARISKIEMEIEELKAKSVCNCESNSNWRNLWGRL